MAERNNPFSMSYDLDEARMVIVAVLREKDKDENIVPVDKTELNYGELHPDLLNFVNLYGLSKLCQDRSSEVKAGPEKLNALREVFNQLVAGQKERARVVGSPVVSVEVEALARIKGISIPDAQRALKNYDKEQKEKILSNPKIVEVARQIEMERASAETSVSLDDLAA